MWGWFGRERHSHEVPHDNPDLAFTMAAVCGVGALSAWRTRGSQMGLLSGVVVSGVFGLGGTWLMGVEPEKHELAHQLCLLASVLFSGAMGYRAGSNVYSGPGGTMLAALGGVSALYHGTKFTEWRNYELGRVQEAERLLREWESPSDAMIARRKQESTGWRVTVSLIHLALFAEIGVLTRTMVDKLMGLGCSGGWGPCLEGGIYFKDLVSNILGSFVIGLFAASSALGLVSEKAVALLPKGHAWQTNLELQLGIRTGYCGSLTTFASWQLELMTAAINNNQWVNMVVGFLVGLFSALVAYVVGCHAALWVDRWVLADREDVMVEMEEYRSMEIEALHQAASGKPLSLAQVSRLSRRSQLEEELEELQPDLPRNVLVAQVEEDEEEVEPDIPRNVLLEDGRVSFVRRRPSAARAASPAAGAGPAADGVDSVDGGAAAHERRREPWTLAQLNEHLRGSRTDLAAAALLAVLTAALAVGVALETRHTWLRTIWVDCLFGPFGCFLRWRLSQYNYKMGGAWAWFPIGTFAANMLGTAIDFALQRVALGYWTGLLLPAVQTGFCGTLTTVSTFVAEVVKFQEVFPEKLHSYTYTAASLGGGILLGLAVYGWSAWAA
eukprot:scaffold23.g4152.t1